jgi:hypothetical protein
MSLRLNSASVRHSLRAQHEPDGKGAAGSLADVNATVAAQLAKLSPSDTETDVHYVPLESLLKRFGVDSAVGLSQDDVAKKQASDGRNVLTPPKQQSYLSMFAWSVTRRLHKHHTSSSIT